MSKTFKAAACSRYLLAVCAFGLTSAASAQEYHYWTNQFGTRSALMGGAMVAGVRDTSATYYNPAGLAYVPDLTLSINADAYQVRSISIEDGAETGKPLESSQPGSVPLLLSGTVLFNDVKLGYSVLARQSGGSQMSQRLQFSQDLLYGGRNVDMPGGNSQPAFGEQSSGQVEDYRGQMSYSSNLSEYWAGLSYGTLVSDRWSVGATAYAAYRSQSSLIAQTARAANQVTHVAATQAYNRSVEFQNLRALLKLGVAADWEWIKAGLTLTTPSVSLSGSGSSSLVFSDINNPIQANNGDQLLDGRQDNLDAEYENPLSVALGLEFLLGQTRVALAAEWFDEVDPYTVVDARSENLVLGNANTPVDANEVLEVRDRARSVTNFAIGIEQRVSNRYTLYLSARTDKSAFDRAPNDPSLFLNNNNYDMGITTWDNNNVTVGFSRTSEKSLLSVGLSYTFASESDYQRFSSVQPFNRGGASSSFFLVPTPGEFGGDATDVSASTVSFLIGWTYFVK
ncbi:MAG: hypothetical protein VX549_14760 [Pseudomonadota bacterium]|nr:hypothetical protein [Pseudomonadota bacterium]